MYVRMIVCMYVCMYVRMIVCMYVCMYVCMHVCMYVCMYVYMYVYMYVCIHCGVILWYCTGSHVILYVYFTGTHLTDIGREEPVLLPSGKLYQEPESHSDSLSAVR